MVVLKIFTRSGGIKATKIHTEPVADEYIKDDTVPPTFIKIRQHVAKSQLKTPDTKTTFNEQRNLSSVLA